jgi:hypothetical protein
MAARPLPGDHQEAATDSKPEKRRIMHAAKRTVTAEGGK